MSVIHAFKAGFNTLESSGSRLFFCCLNCNSTDYRDAVTNVYLFDTFIFIVQEFIFFKLGERQSIKEVILQKYGQKAPVKGGKKNRHASMVAGIPVGSPKPSFPPK